MICCSPGLSDASAPERAYPLADDLLSATKAYTLVTTDIRNRERQG